MSAMTATNRSVRVEDLRSEVLRSVKTGMTIPEHIYDDDGVLLLAAGVRITERFLSLLLRRGITTVRLGPPSDTRTQPSGPQQEAELDAQVSELTKSEPLAIEQTRVLQDRLPLELDKTVDFRPVNGWRRPKLPLETLRLEANRGLQKHEEASDKVSTLCNALESGRRIPTHELRRSVTRFVEMAAVDLDLLPLILAMQETKDEYLYDHCVNVSMLSMAIATQLGLDAKTVTEVGLAGMVHDVGMLRVPEEIRLAPRALTEDEWVEIRRHPLHTLNMLANMRDIPQTVKFICYQVHERSDGAGYPCNQPDARILTLSKIVGIADVYAAMTSNRPHREAMSPYAATKEILYAAKENRFDRPIVRALLDTISLFPVGSCVGLSDGTNARVIRANPTNHTAPVVEELDPNERPTGNIVDLSTCESLKIVSAA